MFARWITLLSALIAAALTWSWAAAQAPTPAPITDNSPGTSPTFGGWRSPNGDSGGGTSSPPGVSKSDSKNDIAPADSAPGPRRSLSRVTNGSGTLPNDRGQVWREYDIAPYTLRVTSSTRPEQAIVDWILRETGYEAWHGETVGLLSADSRALRVYHTPEMQALVSEIVDRFVNSEAETHAFGLRIVTVGSPNWRAKSYRIMRPVPVQSPGMQAWLLAKEDSSLMVADLRKRSDFREHSSPHLLVNNGQSTTVASLRPRNYVKNVLVRPDVWPGFEPETAQIQEGFSLEMSPLLAIDSTTIDAVIKCNVDQVDKMMPVVLDVPTSVAPRQRTQIEVPQITTARMHERFRWPTDQVLLISMGVVASPTPNDGNAIKIPLVSGDGRSDLLVFVESKGKSAPIPSAKPAGDQAQTYRGRY